MNRLRFNGDLLEKHVRCMTELACRKNVLWRPHIPWHVPLTVNELCLFQGAVGVSVAGIAQAERFADSRSESVLISLPPTISDIPLLTQFPESMPLLLTVDHFVQAERLAGQVFGFREECSVVILLRGNEFGPGIRPGQDALQLAQGVSRLKGLRVVGISASISANGDSSSTIKSAVHTQCEFRRAGIDCDLISIDGTWDAIPANNTFVTELRDQTFFHSSEYSAPMIWWEAEVISRPTLGAAVVDAGLLLAKTYAPIWFPDFPDVQILDWHDDCCVISTTGDAQRLGIGDAVRITSGNGR
ncbi:MAG: hypothetical protein MK102_15340 [Fuerstiella sp.]|nr:hypothetical protein [Fuerstiella sp.]